MNKFAAIALGIAVTLTGCQTDDTPVKAAPVAVAPEITLVNDYLNKNGLEVLSQLNLEGRLTRVHASETGAKGTIVSQLPLPGDKLMSDTVIDLVVGGTQADIDQLVIAARPPEQDPSKQSDENSAELAALREALGKEYELDPTLVEAVTLDNIDSVAKVNDAKAVLNDAPVMNLRSMDKQAGKIGDTKAPANTSSASQDGGTQPVELVVGDPNGPVKFSAEQTFANPAAVKVGKWNATFPGPTTEFDNTVQGIPMHGSATRLQDGRILTASCAAVGKKDSSSFGAGAVDQILLYAPIRYGQPIRSGRSDVSAMPAVSTVVATDVGAVRVITWYGYGELCDITLPMNASAASDNPAYELAESMTIGK